MSYQIRACTKVRSAAPVLALLLLLNGCQSAGPKSDAGPPPVQLMGSSWVLVSLGGEFPEGERPLTLDLSWDGQAAGFAGVNRFSAPFTVQKAGEYQGSIQFGEITATKMAGAEPLMKTEQTYLELLRDADGYHAQGGLMELTAGGQPLLRFRQVQGPTKPDQPQN